MDLPAVSADLLIRAVNKHPDEPVVFDLLTAGGSTFIVATHVLVSPAHVLGFLGDYRPVRADGIGVWCESSHPSGGRMLVVVTLDQSVALFGRGGDLFSYRGARVVENGLYRDMLAALTPVPADDPLVVELAALTGNA